MNSRIKWTVKMALMVWGLFSVGQVHAALVAYENVGVIEGAGYYNNAFKIETAGTYKATLTDFNFPSLFGQLSLDVTTKDTSMGKLTAPGSFVFDAAPGTYYARLFGVAGGPLDLGLLGVQIESFTVPPVPIPAAIVLLASGLCVLGQMAWRRREAFGYDTLVTKESYSSAIV